MPLTLPQEAWLVLVTAATPVVELRGAIPLGLALGLPLFQVCVLAWVGNVLPVPVLLAGLTRMLSWLTRMPRVQMWIRRWGERGSSELSHQLQRWGWLGLAVFVAIPLPGTGAWTGAVAASFLGLRFWPSLLAIMVGVAVAAALVAGAGMAVMSVPQ